MADAEPADENAVAPGLGQDPFAGVDQDDTEIRGRRARDHVARVLLVPRRVRDDEVAFLRREKAVGHVDGDALLALGRQAVEQKRVVDFPRSCADLLRVRFQGGQLVVEQGLGIVEQEADERALAVVDAAAGVEAQEALGHAQANARVGHRHARRGLLAHLEIPFLFLGFHRRRGIVVDDPALAL